MRLVFNKQLKPDAMLTKCTYLQNQHGVSWPGTVYGLSGLKLCKILAYDIYRSENTAKGDIAIG